MDEKLQVASLVGEIQTLGYMINAFTEYSVFIWYSGHVDTLDVRIAKNKEDFNNMLLTGDIRLKSWVKDSNEIGEKTLENLKKIKYELRKILRKHDIDYSKLNYETEVVRHYKLI